MGENQGENILWKLEKGDSPLIATAVHDGHDLRSEVAAIMKLSERDRLREEDPYTNCWVDIAETHIVALRSRFEVDLNRPRDKAVYVMPGDCWDLDIWKEKPSDKIIEKSLEEYDSYYSLIKELFTEAETTHGKFVLYDIHSYNHRRKGARYEPEPSTKTPEVNIGTGTLNRKKWGGLIDRFINDLSAFDFMGRKLDVRENVKFKGGNQVKWLHENFAETGCGLAIEFKKFWMDEWTGEKNEEMVTEIHKALSSTVAGVLDELKKL